MVGLTSPLQPSKRLERPVGEGLKPDIAVVTPNIWMINEKTCRKLEEILKEPSKNPREAIEIPQHSNLLDLVK